MEWAESPREMEQSKFNIAIIFLPFHSEPLNICIMSSLKCADKELVFIQDARRSNLDLHHAQIVINTHGNTVHVLSGSATVHVHVLVFSARDVSYVGCCVRLDLRLIWGLAKPLLPPRCIMLLWRIFLFTEGPCTHSMDTRQRTLHGWPMGKRQPGFIQGGTETCSYVHSQDHFSGLKTTAVRHCLINSTSMKEGIRRSFVITLSQSWI